MNESLLLLIYQVKMARSIGVAEQIAGQVQIMISRAHGSKTSRGRVEMAPETMTTGHCQIQLKPGGAVTPFPSVDPEQSFGGVVGAKPPEALKVLHFTIPKNELKATFFLLNCSIKTIVIVLSHSLLDHLSFRVAAN